MIYKAIKTIFVFLFPNVFRDIRTNKVIKKEKQMLHVGNVYYYWWNKHENFGDYISTVVFSYMTRDIQPISTSANKIKIITGVGSVISFLNADFTIWGSGLLNSDSYLTLKQYSQKPLLDVRLVRGPLTRAMLLESKIISNIPELYGDPSLLMPIIYKPSIVHNNKYIIIAHYAHYGFLKERYPNKNIINAETNDYRFILDQIASSEKVISSSLHGIIMAESYGVPAVLLRTNKDMDLFKYLDYYYSTNRKDIVIADTIEEAEVIEPMPLPNNLEELKDNVLSTFPYDLFV